MEERGLTDVELRAMLHEADAFRLDVVPGRVVIDCRSGEQAWEVIVEPDLNERLLVVITAYRIGS